ncbi:MAG TPA: VOC family protein [Candidatus Didemnitutus sp.]|nr:VOC family protein [Candidatus Didemnitutus sp.]
MKVPSIAPVFAVKNVDATVKYFVDVLGFKQDFRFEEYASVTRGELALHVTSAGVFPRPIGGGTAYIFVEDVDKYFKEVSARGARLKQGLQDQPYGLRDFTVEDPDGNLLSFGKILLPQ